jgi:molecular chaperone GrpE
MISNQETDGAHLAGDREQETREIEIDFADQTPEASVEEESAQAPESEPTEIESQEQTAAQAVEDEDSAPAQEEAQSDPPRAETAPVNGAAAAGDGQGVALAELQSQIESLVREKSALYDQLLRRQAEFENYRKRVERDRAETYNRARADIIRELLPVIDNFERALVSLEKSGEDAEGLRHGIELIHKQFKDILTKLGLEPVEAVGQKFDPHVHEAVTMEVTDEHEENMILEEFERGYKLGDRLLRPSKVKVASNPES